MLCFSINNCEHHRHDMTTNQSERRKNCRSQSATSTIFKVAATKQELAVAEQEILTAWIDEQALAEAVPCYPILPEKYEGVKDLNQWSVPAILLLTKNADYENKMP